MIDILGVVDVDGEAGGVFGVALGVTETDGTGVFDTGGVIGGVEDTLGDTGILLGVTLGVIETDGTGVFDTGGVIDGVDVTLGDKGTVRTGHSNV